MTSVSEIVARFEQFAPQSWAEEGDPVGLQIGSMQQSVHKLMVTLDVRPEVVTEAVKNNVDFIFAHHPALFRPIKKFDLTNPQNKMYAELIKHNITVYAAHTNLDNANGGMNDWLASLLDLQDTEILLSQHEDSLFKLAVFVPKKSAETVRNALTDAGAGTIGEYQDCSYTISGTGRFTPQAASNPTIGNLLEPTEVAEDKIEVVFPKRICSKILKVMRVVHPYEEPVFDLFAVQGNGTKYGMGRIGDLKSSMTISAFAEYCKTKFDVLHLRVVTADTTQKVKRVAILGGSGGQFYTDALRKKADVYITGDISYHTGHDIIVSGLTAIDPGHHIEQICKPHLQNLFAQWNNEYGWQIKVVQSAINTDPFMFI
ncbi:Nif3-like dinuclear metal center hexameric protein [Lactobacillus sp. UCMA15818]|uniref:Nif3-like dinuclear metal center hexameric protein n=1 Tax=Lactobacillus sp. UCMA15818 TaxID=2583394 RepID=UPI0025AFAE77|nr:Nif3-like dinuclear metal center hexameric protein [Lactobacillus sp. UCMA15818]MDN2452301.1 Nif3-like dinuclear metal center hexameric protein [Lactobacillus sp. UCMA15818]